MFCYSMYDLLSLMLLIVLAYKNAIVISSVREKTVLNGVICDADFGIEKCPCSSQHECNDIFIRWKRPRPENY